MRLPPVQSFNHSSAYFGGTFYYEPNFDKAIISVCLASSLICLLFFKSVIRSHLNLLLDRSELFDFSRFPNWPIYPGIIAHDSSNADKTPLLIDALAKSQQISTIFDSSELTRLNDGILSFYVGSSRCLLARSHTIASIFKFDQTFYDDNISGRKRLMMFLSNLSTSDFNYGIANYLNFSDTFNKKILDQSIFKMLLNMTGLMEEALAHCNLYHDIDVDEYRKQENAFNNIYKFKDLVSREMFRESLNEIKKMSRKGGNFLLSNFFSIKSKSENIFIKLIFENASLDYPANLDDYELLKKDVDKMDSVYIMLMTVLCIGSNTLSKTCIDLIKSILENSKTKELMMSIIEEDNKKQMEYFILSLLTVLSTDEVIPKKVQHSFITWIDGLPLYIKKGDLLFLYQQSGLTPESLLFSGHHSINDRLTSDERLSIFGLYPNRCPARNFSFQFLTEFIFYLFSKYDITFSKGVFSLQSK